MMIILLALVIAPIGALSCAAGPRPNAAVIAIEQILSASCPQLDDATEEGLEKSLNLYLDKSRETYPEAKARFVAGLPPQSILVVMWRFPEADPKVWEGELVLVEEIVASKVSGRIWMGADGGDVDVVRVTFPESEVADWILVDGNGRVEGNWLFGNLCTEGDRLEE